MKKFNLRRVVDRDLEMAGGHPTYRNGLLNLGPKDISERAWRELMPSGKHRNLN